MANAKKIDRPALAMQYVDRTVFSTVWKLQRSDNLAASEWYLYHWLLALACATDSPILRVNTGMIRHGVQTGYGFYPPAKLALNTIKATLDRLEASGAITVTKSQTGRVTELDIMF